jgi:CubicO group peptidase (beta-lactamase class C family)
MKHARALLIGMLVVASCGGEPTTPVLPPPPPPPPPPATPLTGAAVPGMASFDQSVPALLKKYGIPGGAVAVVHNGKLFYARGFGYADVTNKVSVAPDALFRIASVSKPITSAAIMKLVEDGKLALDDRVAPLIAHLTPAPGATVDPRWEQITIRQLLDHTGGWDRDKPGGFDPMFVSAVAAAAVGAPAPASAETIIRYMKGKPLDFNPGEKFVYSNFGYCILGRVIERLGGMPYGEFVRTRVLQPVGASRTQLGRTRLADALPQEVRYYFAGAGIDFPMVPSVFPGEGAVPANYGGYYLEATDSHGGWVSSTVDLLRFMVRVDGRDSPPDILSAALVAEMTSNGVTLCPDGSCYYAGGWFVRPVQSGATWWHGGDYAGTKAILVRSYYQGISWVGLFNAGAPNNFTNELEAALWQSLNGMTSFPAQDLFSSFP